jgi:hypothetical protein
MQMRARNYSILNRTIARSVSYALRDSNRRKYKSKNTYSNPNNTVKMPEVNNTEGSGAVIAWICAVFGVLIILAVVFPSIMWLYLIIVVLGFVFIK